MKSPSPEGASEFVRNVVGAILALASILFFWKGTPAIGEVGFDLTYVTARFSTASAGLALLISGVLLLLPKHHKADGAPTSIAPSTTDILIAIGFYGLIGFLPSFTFVAVGFYLHTFRPDLLDGALPGVIFIYAYTQVPAVIWLVARVTPLLKATKSVGEQTSPAIQQRPGTSDKP